MKHKKSLLLGFLSIYLLLIIGCSQGQIIDNGGIEVPADDTLGLANPASQYCIEIGGNLKSMENNLGQYNLCVLADGSEIEEWEYFNSQNNNNYDNDINSSNEEKSFICTREYMPVCAQTTINSNGIPVLETFSNNCMAQDAQFIHNGECGKDSLQAADMRICTMEYMPVCAMFNGQPKTFGNACGAEGLEVISQGEC